MSKYKNKKRDLSLLHNAAGAVLVERLEQRALFSGSIPLIVASISPPVSHIAMAKHPVPPKVKAVISNGTGLSAEYYYDAAMQQPYVLRTDPTIAAPKITKLDQTGVVAKAIVWTGQISPSYSEAYSFSTVSGGGIRLWVNGQLLINQPVSVGGRLAANATIILTAGIKYSIRLEFTRTTSAPIKVQLLWASQHQKQASIPQSALFPDTNASFSGAVTGLIGQYYLGKNFNQLVMQRVDPGINFNFLSFSPTTLIPAHSSFSVRWTGQIIPQYSETYTFTASTDDGVRLWVGDQLLINDFVDHTVHSDTAQITLVAGQAYDLRMDYYEDHGVASAKLQWSSPSQPLQVVPASALTSTPVATAGVLTASAVDDQSINLSWTGSSTATGYLVQQSTDNGASYETIADTAATVTSYLLSGLTPATPYLLRVIPNGSVDTSTPSNSVLVSTATDSPGGPTVTALTSTTASLSWADVAGENGFNVYETPAGSASANVLQIDATATDTIDALSTSAAQLIGTTAAGVTTFTATGLTPGAAYQFTVSALNADGTPSAPGAPASATTLVSAPASNAITAISVGGVAIHWADTAGENGFVIQRSLDGIDGWTQIATTAQGVTSYTDSGLQPGTTYYYRVLGIDAGGASDPSSIISAVTAVSAPGGIVTSSPTATGTNLAWADVPGEDGFAVLESTNGGNTFSQIQILPAGTTSTAVTGLTSGLNYEFEVVAINSAGALSAASAPASAQTIPAAPLNVVITDLSTTAASLSWADVTGEAGFIVKRSSDGVSNWTTLATLPTGTLNYTDNALAAGSMAYYSVSAINSGGTSAASTVASVLTLPAAPVAALTGLSTAQSQVSWGAVSSATQYIIQRSLDGMTGWTTAASATGTSLSSTVANLAASTMYYYRVAAVNATGTSAQSAIVSQVSAPLAQYVTHSVVYGSTNTGAIYAVDLVNGTATWIGQTSVIPQAAVRDPLSGVMYFYKQGTSNIYVWNPVTGNTSLVDTSFIPVPTVSGAYLPNGTSYIVGNNGTLFKGASGTLSVTTIGTLNIAGTPLSGTPSSMSFSPTGTLYMTVGANLYTVNTSTAAVTPIATMVTGTILAVFGPKGLLYTTDSSGNLYSLNLTSLVDSLLGSDNLPSFTSLAADVVFTHLSLTATGSPTTFTKGGNASYALTVSNTTGDASTQPITITTTLPTGVTYSSVTGTGWTASVTGQAVTLSYTGGIAAGGSLAVTLNVAVSSSASSVVVSSFTAVGSDLDASLTAASATATNLAT